MWWTGATNEPYWMELTEREDLGGQLWNSEVGAGGGTIPSTPLLDVMEQDDVVFHYHKGLRAIVGRSRVASGSGVHGRRNGQRYIGREIDDYEALATGLSLDQIRGESAAVFAAFDSIKAADAPPYFFPFVPSAHGGQPAQSYMSKFPRAAVEALSLMTPTPTLPMGVPRNGPKPPPSKVSKSDPFSTDPDKVDRGTKGHHDTEEALRAFVAAQGAQPLDANPLEPPFDLGWTNAGTCWIAEVKSTTHLNEEKQLRYGLGQLIRYGHALAHVPVRLVLVAENPVSDASWLAACESLGVVLTWPGAFAADLVAP